MTSTTNKNGDYITTLEGSEASKNDVRDAKKESTQKSNKILISRWSLVFLALVQLASLVALVLLAITTGLVIIKIRSDNESSEDRVAALEEKLDNLESRFNESLSGLMLNKIVIANNTLQELNTFLEKLNTSYSNQLTSILTDVHVDMLWLNETMSNVTDHVIILDDESNECTRQIGLTSVRINGIEADIIGLNADIGLIKGNLGLP
ncbi:uncharacterized protein LOC142345521 [Convolutriloba macropyga]|uniref:uncharacterized protein LOC142345521 n=1 Tax=Convolutriloba macropyga TaxID=536237 RepID=UPI003F527130